MIRSHKKDVKYWRKELGEEIKVKMKLEKILEIGNKNEVFKPPTVKKKNERIVQKSNEEKKTSIKT